MLYLDVCGCDMEKGNLRCDANISVMPEGESEFGVRTELKNLNSFRNVEKALSYEIERQTSLIESGETVPHETLYWDDDEGVTKPMRTKERAHDYRYFPEPDLPPLVIEDERITEIKHSMPELPFERRKRYKEEYEIPDYDIGILSGAPDLADYYEETLKEGTDPKKTANWIINELLAKLKEDGIDISGCPLSPENLGELIRLIESETISGKIAKDIFDEVYRKDLSPEKVVEEKGLKQITDDDAIREIILKVMDENSDAVRDYRDGKEKVLGFLVGQVMKETKGKANPQTVNKILKEELSE